MNVSVLGKDDRAEAVHISVFEIAVETWCRAQYTNPYHSVNVVCGGHWKPVLHLCGHMPRTLRLVTVSLIMNMNTTKYVGCYWQYLWATKSIACRR